MLFCFPPYRSSLNSYSLFIQRRETFQNQGNCHDFPDFIMVSGNNNEIILLWQFSRPEYWSGQPFPSPGDLPNPGIKPSSPSFQVDSLPTELSGKPSALDNGEKITLFCFPPYRRSLNSYCLFIQRRETFQGQGNCYDFPDFIMLSHVSNEIILLCKQYPKQKPFSKDERGEKNQFMKIHVIFHTYPNTLSTYFATGIRFSLIRTIFLPPSEIFSSYPARHAAMFPGPQMKLQQKQYPRTNMRLAYCRVVQS